MLTLVVIRLLQAIPLILIISFVGFLVIQATGDPLAAFTVEADLTADDIQRLKAKYGLDKPKPIQYLNWLKHMLTGDWGFSYYTREPVAEMVLSRLPNTLILMGFSYVAILILGVTLGVLSAVYQYSIFDHIVTGISFLGIAAPSFWLALMLIYLFAVQFMQWGLPSLPVSGMFEFEVGKTFWQVVTHVILPATALATVVTARYIRFVRAEMLEKINMDFVRTARAKGISRTTVLFKHVLPNALLPLITLIGLDIPNFMSGTIVIETVFSWPGMGRLFWSAAERTDIPVLMATMMLVAVLTVSTQLLADLFYGLVDPRISYDRD